MKDGKQLERMDINELKKLIVTECPTVGVDVFIDPKGNTAVLPIPYNAYQAYKIAARLECEQCGKCEKGATGIRFMDWEIPDIANYVNKRKRYVSRMLDDNGMMCAPCKFLDMKKHKCTIYPVRPIVCRIYPMCVVTYEKKQYMAVTTICEPARIMLERLKVAPMFYVKTSRGGK